MQTDASKSDTMASWDDFWVSWAALEVFGKVFGDLLGELLGGLGVVWVSWGALGRSWGGLGWSWGDLGATC